MRIHQDWSTPLFKAAPAARDIGPFGERDFLEAWWDHRAGDGDELLLVESDSALLPLVRLDGTVEFLGEPDLADYHAPLGDGIAAVVTGFLRSLPAGTPFRFDSLPAEAAEPIAAGVEAAGIDAEPVQHTVAAVLRLPADWDEYLASIGKKERHEVRRKRRRFAEAVGAPRLVRAESHEALERFVAMHRSAEGEKGDFMTPAMVGFFSLLLERCSAEVDLLYGDGPEPVAAAFGFDYGDGYYLYNSAYDPDAREASPGIVLLSMLIQGAIRRDKQVFDFLKGDETYKFRHGAEPRPLLVIEGTTDGSG